MTAAPGEPIRIANCSGFFGDRPSGAHGDGRGRPDRRAHRRLAGRADDAHPRRIRAKRPGGGFARTFVDPDGAGDGHLPRPRHQGGVERRRPRPRRLRRRGRRGRRPARPVAHDRLRRRRRPAAPGRRARRRRRRRSHPFETGEPSSATRRGSSRANAYLGCWGIVEALTQGADIVDHRTRHRRRGRVRPGGLAPRLAARRLGPARRAVWSPATSSSAARRPPAATTRSSPRSTAATRSASTFGFPWAEVAADGSSRDRQARRHRRRGVNVDTVTSQLLYEIGGPEYLGPDVTARFDTIELEQVGRDRVRVFGVRGRAAAADAEGGDERARRLPQRRSPSRSPGSTSRRRRRSSRRRSGTPARTAPTTSPVDRAAGSSAPTSPIPATQRGGRRRSGGSR